MDNYTLPPDGRQPTPREADYLEVLKRLNDAARLRDSGIRTLLLHAAQAWRASALARGLLMSEANARVSVLELELLATLASVAGGPGLDTLLRVGVSSPDELTRIVAAVGERALAVGTIAPIPLATLSAPPMTGEPLADWREVLGALRAEGHPVSLAQVHLGEHAGDVRLLIPSDGETWGAELLVRGIDARGKAFVHHEPLAEEAMRAVAALLGGLRALALLPLSEVRRSAGSEVLRGALADVVLGGGVARDVVRQAAIMLRELTRPEDLGPEPTFWLSPFVVVVTTVDAFAGFRPEPLTGAPATGAMVDVDGLLGVVVRQGMVRRLLSAPGTVRVRINGRVHQIQLSRLRTPERVRLLG